jgi:hypothetical protein
VPGRFSLYTDADVQNQVIKALKDAGWDVVRAIDEQPEGTADLTHFQRAAAQGRVLVTNDDDQKRIAFEWYAASRPFPGVVWWPQEQYQAMTPGDVVHRLEEYAAESSPFAFPVRQLKPYL